jgi:hypothetical protein
MSYVPVLPVGGYGGWAMLKRTKAAQLAAFVASPAVRREADHARATLAQVPSAEALVADRRLLGVALGAFGLEADINARAFVRKVLESPTSDPRSLVNRLADRRYGQFARSFGFGQPGGPGPRPPGFAEEIVSAHLTRRFEAAVGTRDESLRLALNADREIAALAASGGSDAAQWFAVMGAPPLRKVFEGALGLPASFGRLDIDRQREIFAERAERQLGSGRIADLADPERREGLIRRFLLRAEAGAALAPGAASGASGALALLQAGGFQLNRLR